MKKLIYSFLYIGLSVIILTSCQQSTNFTPSDIKSKSARIINDDEVAFIGQQHNAILDKVFSDYNWETDNFQSELMKRFKEEDILLDPDKERRAFYTNQSEQNFLEEDMHLLKNELSSSSYLLLEEILALSENIDSYSSLLDKITDLQIKIKGAPESVVDKNVLLVTLGTLKSSAYFWMPANEGGSGVGYRVLKNINNARINEGGLSYGNGDGEGNGNGTICFAGWRVLLKADSMSAGVGMIFAAAGLALEGVAVGGVVVAATAAEIAAWPVGVIALVLVAGESAVTSGMAAVVTCAEK